MARKARKRKTSQQIAEKWVNAMSSPATAKAYQEGVNGKGQTAMNNAASSEAMQRYADGCARSVANGSRLRSLSDPLSARLYNENAPTRGSQNLGPGAAKKKLKYQAQIDRLQSVYDQMGEAANAVDPTGSIGTAPQRSAAALQVLIAAGKKGGM